MEYLAAAVEAPPAWTELRALVGADDYFRPTLGASRILRHTWQQVGRGPLLEELDGWVARPSSPVLVLSGRGGIGKSKLLHAFSEGFADRHPGVALRFAVNEVPLDVESLGGPPAATTVVVVDDAHHRDDLAVLLAYARQHAPSVRLLLATRPHGVGPLHTALTQARFDVREVQDVTVTDLTREDTTALARQALGDGFDHYAPRLADLTRDSPLVTVLGGQLLAERRVAPELLERDEEFRRVLLDRFRDEIAGEALTEVAPELRRGLLPLIAALSPVRPDDGRFLEAAAAFLGTQPGILADGLDALEAAGVLLRRGRTLRITPDVLADHVLLRACVRDSGLATGYAERLFAAFRTLYPEEVLRSLAELDWRIRASGDPGAGLLNAVWRSIDEEVRRGSHRQRRDVLSQLAEVAHLQPERVVPLVEFVMRNPDVASADEGEDSDEVIGRLGRSHDDVLEVLPRVLRRVGLHIGYLRRCCDLLWELGRDDARPTGPNPDHAMRVLVDIAEFDIDKPYAVNGIVLDAAGRWFEAPDALDHTQCPLDVVDAALAKSGDTSWSEGYRFVISPFAVDPDATADLRRRALDLVLGVAGRGSQRGTLRAIKSLFLAAEPPRGPGGGHLSEEEAEPWLAARLEAMAHVEVLVATATDPVVLLRVASDLAWYVGFRPDGAVGERAVRILASIPRTIDLRLAAALTGKLDLWAEPGQWRRTGNWEERDERRREIVAVCADELTTTHSDPRSTAEVIDAGLQRLVDAGIETAPGLLLDALTRNGADFLAGLAEWSLERPASQLARYLHSFLSSLRDLDRDRAVHLARRALESPDRVVQWAVGSWARVCAKDPTVGDLEVVRRVVAHPDPGIRQEGLRSLGALGRSHPGEASEIALGADIGTSPELAAALCMAVEAGYGIDPATLEDDDVVTILDKVAAVDEIDDYHVLQFLRLAATRIPHHVVGMLLERVRTSRDHDRPDFQPIPQFDLGIAFAGVSAHPQHRALLEPLREAALADGWWTTFWLPRLFAAVSDRFAPASVAVLREWAESSDAGKVRGAAKLLHDATPSFVFEHRDLAVTLLEEANRLGGNCFEEVAFHVGNPARTEMRSRTLGVEAAAAQDVLLRHRSTDALVDLVPGSPAYRFYAGLQAFAEQNIRRSRIEDEEEFG